AVDALRSRYVDLDTVVEVKEPLGATSVPDDRVERAHQCRNRRTPRDLGVAMYVRDAPGSLDSHRRQITRVDEVTDGGSVFPHRHAEVVPNFCLRRDTQRTSGDRRELALRFFVSGSRQIADVLGYDPLRYVVHPGERGVT